MCNGGWPFPLLAYSLSTASFFVLHSFTTPLHPSPLPEGNAPGMFPELVSVLRTLGLSDEQSIADLEALAGQADQVREVVRG